MRALGDAILDDDGEVIGLRKVKGINELLEVSRRHFPEYQQQSFANALSLKHRKAIEIKRAAAGTVIAVAATTAGAVGAAPLPFASALALAPIQIAMIIKISQIYGMSVTRDSALPIVTALVGSVGATIAGKLIAARCSNSCPASGRSLAV